MTERELQQTLSETSEFLQRQQLLKQLWRSRLEREADATEDAPERSRSGQRDSAMRAEAVMA